MVKTCVVMATFLLALSPATVRADWLFTPNLGTTFGGAAEGNGQFTYGAGLGWMGAGVFGWEFDLSHTPDFFEGAEDTGDIIDESSVTSAMFNALFGIPVGGQAGAGFRPYVAGGVGLLKREVRSADDFFDISTNDWGFNLGGGAMIFMSDHVGLRGDVRFLRSFEDLDEGFDPGSFEFWRGTVGVTFRW